MNIKQELLAKKKRKLESIRRRLKKDFVGIDDVIDEVIDSIKVWYCVPDAITRPVIINLWGMTGVGKTDLVRRLVRYMKMSDKYVEVIMSSDGNNDSWSNKAQSVLFDSDINQGEPGIVLFDEIQKYRTKDENGKEIDKKYFNDMWVLLSDGKFSAHGRRGQIERFLQRICMHQYEEDTRLNKKEEDINKEELEELVVQIAEEDGESRTEDELKSVVESYIDEIKSSKDKKKYREFAINSWDAERFKKLLNLDMQISDIVRLSECQVIDMLMDGVKKPELLSEDDYSKLLIFISGNLDEAYTMSDRVENSDSDADAVRAWTENIDITVIKSCLMKRFRAEQIARFGNNHVIYRSMSKESYTELIRRKINEGARDLSSSTNVNVRIRKSVNQLVYNNGVYPTQGTRPVFSTITEVMAKSVPDSIMRAVELGVDHTTVGYDFKKRRFVCDVGDEKVYIPYTGSIDNIKDGVEACLDRKALIAAHESGHALVYCILFGAIPVQVSPVSSFRGGFIMQHTSMKSKMMLYNDIVVLLAGRAAEQIVFGNDHVCEGALTDMVNATQKASLYIRKHGFNRVIGFHSIDKDLDFVQSSKNTDIEMTLLLSKALSDARHLIENSMEAFMDLTLLLRKSRKVSSEQIKLVMDNHRIKADIINVKKQIISQYAQCLDGFINGRKGLSAGLVAKPMIEMPTQADIVAMGREDNANE